MINGKDWVYPPGVGGGRLYIELLSKALQPAHPELCTQLPGINKSDKKVIAGLVYMNKLKIERRMLRDWDCLCCVV